MLIGVPKELKNNENRVAATPNAVFDLVRAGHEVLIERGAGLGSFISDDEYAAVGGTLIDNVDEIWARAELIYKVKEPLPVEYDKIREGQILFTYLHLAADPEQTKALLAAKCIGVAYETITASDGSLPLLIPMSEVAGRLAPQIGANLLLSYHGGDGMLLSGVPGTPPAEVVIVGCGHVGLNAARLALGMGAHVTVLDINSRRLTYIDELYEGRITTLQGNSLNYHRALATADLLIGAVLIPGAKTPKVITEEMVRGMKKGSVIVDVAIDQGGCIETIDRVTTHDDPTYERYGVIHYSVANMPGAVPRTSTFALANATAPYLLKIANLGLKEAVRADSGLKNGLNVYRGTVTFKAVAEALELPWRSPDELL